MNTVKHLSSFNTLYLSWFTRISHYFYYSVIFWYNQGMELKDTEQFFKQYRDATKVQRDTQTNLLEEQRRQQQAGVMSQANTAGMLYSNFPQRSLIQYDTNTYLPAIAKLNTGYLTGLNDLRNKGTQLANNITAIEGAIADLNNDIYATI